MLRKITDFKEKNVGIYLYNARKNIVIKNLSTFAWSDMCLCENVAFNWPTFPHLDDMGVNMERK